MQIAKLDRAANCETVSLPIEDGIELQKFAQYLRQNKNKLHRKNKITRNLALSRSLPYFLSLGGMAPTGSDAANVKRTWSGEVTDA